MRRRKNNFPVRPLALVFIILLALGFILGYIWRILTSADYFLVKDVVSREALSVDLSYLKGKNIFSLDLPRESAQIARGCPDCLRVRLARVIPNRIYVEFIRRKPIALLKLYRFFAVDGDGVIFPNSSQPERASLPTITGLETKIFGPKPGMRYTNRELDTALAIIREVGRTPLLKDYKIQKVNTAGVDNITILIFLPQGQVNYSDWKAPEKKDFLEIKFGQGSVRDKVAIMAGLINQEKRNLSNIKYIDLRFNEPVIKFKEEKK